MDVSRKGIVVSVGFILAAVFLLYDSYTTKEVYLNEGALYPMTYPRILLGIWIVLSGPARVRATRRRGHTEPAQGAAYHSAHYGGVGRIYDPAASPRFPGCELPAALRRIPHPPLSLPDQAHTDRPQGHPSSSGSSSKADQPSRFPPGRCSFSDFRFSDTQAQRGCTMVDSILAAFQMSINAETLLIVFIGAFYGTIIGALPGLGTVVALTMCLPFTLHMENVPAIALLLAVYCGSVFGGSISAVLINTPGTPQSAATGMDGYPMAKRGQAGQALGWVTVASVTAVSPRASS